mgnify:FL=1|jgi:hypothetical protein
MNYTDRIFPTNKGLTTYLDELIGKNYQIPTFQRDVVWQQENVKKLWDSIYKFYPLGSILVWKTDLKLQNHRSIGGHEITDPGFSRTEYQYILDGQQRTTSLLTSLYGGSIADRPGFEPLVYVDLTIPIENDTDDESYRSRFLFWTEIDDQNGRLLQNAGRQKRFDQGLIVKLIDIKNQFSAIQNQVFNSALVNKDFNHAVLQELSKIKGVLDNYRISFIEVKGIQVAEVCQIFERINQAGKPLDIFDIVVAKTFRPSPTNGTDGNGFYLRDLIGDFRKTNQSEFLKISDIDYLQILAVIIGRQIPDSGVLNITDRYLNEIRTEHIAKVWPGASKAIQKMFDFLENHLHIHSPSLVPYRYFYFSIASYFYENSNPDYELLKKYFWFYSFHNEDLLSNTTQLRHHLDFLDGNRQHQATSFGAFQIDRQKLRGATYSSKGRWSRAILSLYASARPKDWEHIDRDVLAHNLFFSTDKPNLHHIFPTNSAYVLSQPHQNRITSDSLMNIAYLPQITNLDISNREPLSYLKDYDKPGFETVVVPSHLLPAELLDWARQGQLPPNAIDLFIEARVEQILTTLKARLPGIQINEIDTLT